MPFLLDESHYQSETDILRNYLEQASYYLHKKKNIPLEEAQNKIKAIMKQRLKNPTIAALVRDETTLDRKAEHTTLLDYIYSSKKENNIIAPTFTTYSKDKSSILAEFIKENVKRRSAAKKEAHKAKAEGNMEVYKFKNNEQQTMKIYNNSLSGAFAQKANILYNDTGHNTLTTITRTVGSIINANNEKLITGNRFYYDVDSILNNINYIISTVDLDKNFKTAMKYGLHIPSYDDVMQVIRRSSDLYYVNDDKKILESYVKLMDDRERTSFVYAGDLYHIRKYNEKFMRSLIEDFTAIDDTWVYDDVDKLSESLHALPESILNYIHQIFFHDVKGYGKDYKRLGDVAVLNKMLSTAYRLMNTIDRYQDFIFSFISTDAIPSSANKMKYMRRRAVVLSDTDSTCFTVDDWTRWYFNTEILEASTEMIRVASCISFFATESISHILAKVSANMNVKREHLHILNMKNEFLWTFHLPTEVSKHYAALTVMQEGSVFAKEEMEIKGVHLKNSAIHKSITTAFKDLIEDIFKTLSRGELLKMREIVDRIAAIETKIEEGVLAGDPIYFTKSTIKEKTAYALDETKSPYARHTFWKEVWESAYGIIPEPPYYCIAVPTTITNITSLRNWLETLPPTEFKDKLVTWLERNKKKDLPTLYLNMEYVATKGLPDVVKPIVNVKGIIINLTLSFRLLLEALGVYLHEGKTIKEHFRLGI